jgi:hypothetical protein
MINDDTLEDKNFLVVVWPDRDPEISENSTLIELNEDFVFSMIELEHNDEITFRMYENATETLTGFIYEPLKQTEVDGLSCIELLDSNYDNFAHGYSQWHFKAKYLTFNCTDSISLTRFDGMGDDILEFSVTMAECPAPDVPCIEGEEIQSLNIWNCACEPLE